MKIALWGGVGYLVVLLIVIATGLIVFRGLADAPRPTLGTTFAPQYQGFLGLIGGLLAVYLGGYTGFLAKFFGRMWIGATGFGVGSLATIAAFSLLPWVRFPFDQYAAGVAWVFSSMPIGVCVWILVILHNRIARASDHSTLF
ncbi:MAG TPA: hypothetical protein VNN55_09845 [bacterium]|nr:hypothetical protein [bacterium]